MGLNVFDWWTLGHFFMGVISTMGIYPKNPGLSMFIGNIAHAYIEYNEIDYLNGIHVNSMKNNYGDMIAYFFGSLLGILFTPLTIKYPIIRWILLISVTLSGIQEWGRESYPKTWPIDRAFAPLKWFGTVKEFPNK